MIHQVCGSSFFFFFNFIFGCAGSSLLHGVFSSCGAWASHCSGFSYHRAWLSSCGVGVKLLHSMWDLPSPGMELASPALTGRFFTTEILRKPWKLFLSVTSH